MRNALLRFFINAAAIGIIVSGILPGIRITGNTLPTLVVVAVIFGLINTFIKPIIQLVTCPIVVLTLGLFLFIINGVMLYVTAFLSDVVARSIGVGGTLMIDNILWAVVGAVIVTIVSVVLEQLLRVNEPRVVVQKVEIREVAARTRSQADAEWDAALRGDMGGFGEDVIDPNTGKPRIR